MQISFNKQVQEGLLIAAIKLSGELHRIIVKTFPRFGKVG